MMITKFDIPSGDALIHCQVSCRENAPALVFLHGNGEDFHIFDPSISHFSSDYHIVAIDTRAHGLSTRGTAPLDFHTFSDDLFTVLNTLKINKTHILGFSDGAITALHAALVAPERISSMVLIGVNYHPKGIRWIPRMQIRLHYLLKRSVEKEIWGLMVHQPNLTIEELTRIKIPTLLITGERDLVSQRHNDKINRAITGSGRIIVPKGDHFWLFTQPELLHRYVGDFLQESIAKESIRQSQS